MKVIDRLLLTCRSFGLSNYSLGATRPGQAGVIVFMRKDVTMGSPLLRYPQNLFDMTPERAFDHRVHFAHVNAQFLKAKIIASSLHKGFCNPNAVI